MKFRQQKGCFVHLSQRPDVLVRRYGSRYNGNFVFDG